MSWNLHAISSQTIKQKLVIRKFWRFTTGWRESNLIDPRGKYGASLVAQWKRIHLKCRKLGFETWVRSLVRKIPWRMKWQFILVFLLGKSHGQRSLAGFSPWVTESDKTEQLSRHTHWHTYTAMCKTDASGKLLYSTGNSAWCSVMT